KVSASADVVLFEGGDTTGTVLWQLTLDQTVDLGDGRGHPPPNGTDLIPRAVRMLAQQALQGLPMRDPVAARATTPARWGSELRSGGCPGGRAGPPASKVRTEGAQRRHVRATVRTASAARPGRTSDPENPSPGTRGKSTSAGDQNENEAMPIT